ncbi:putative tail fiber protein [Achromobacter phage vB_AxyP_19-32_Axy09]|uniref:Putative tail fiber protein n=1 Tax=Achromobacter phage vB_AxyP_19-32_Axy09 TaxID=2591040 RepID=A0A514CTR6_9CAUD|nr:putative tail fiber protein [Achromobacter phage vB_AxyP_19-32_Axy09]
MAAFEASYPALLQGVSQQIARERLPGQVTGQDNMLSDTVTGLRRRPGVKLEYADQFADAGAQGVRGMFTDIGGKRYHVLHSGRQFRLLNEDFTPVAAQPYVFDTTGYFPEGTVAEDLRTTVVGDKLFVLNRKVKPVTVLTSEAAVRFSGGSGYFTVLAGQYSKTYSVTVAFKWEGTTNPTTYITATYTTPTGANAGDAAVSTVDYIAETLAQRLRTQAPTMTFISTTGTTIAVRNTATTETVTVTTTSGDNYINTSGARVVPTTGRLAPRLPDQMNGFVMGVGNTRSKDYFMWSAKDQQWLESAAAQADVVTAFRKMPVHLEPNVADGKWYVRNPDYEGMLAGDLYTNPPPDFDTQGITGIGTFQGRLVLLSGPYVAMSDSRVPRRFCRTTVTTLLDSDPIYVASSANSSAAYDWCVPFQKDLLLFSSAYQALVPAGNQAITPRTATVLLTSTYAADTRASPVAIGRTLMYSAPRSANYFGMKEMLPSPYTDSQYTSNDSTPHLPKYMPGRCRFAASSNTSNIVVFGASGDEYSLIVHEYLWSGEEKLQQAWHRWTFKYPVSHAYFAADKLVLVFARGATVALGTLDVRAGMLAGQDRPPFVDLYRPGTIQANGRLDLDNDLWNFDTENMAKNLTVCIAQGEERAGDMVGIVSRHTNYVMCEPSHAGAKVMMGLNFLSSITPTQPMVKDENGVKISSNKLTLLRMLLSMRNSSEFVVTVRDAQSEADFIGAQGAVYWASHDLALGRPRVAEESLLVVPMRTEADSTLFRMSTDGTGEMNLAGLEYVCRFNQRIRRK